MAALIAVPLALALGMLAALYRNSLFDRIVNSVTLTTISLPGILRRLYPDVCFFADQAAAWFYSARPTCRANRQRLPRACLARRPAGPDAHPGHRRPHDAHDARRDHQPARQPLYRDGPAQGRLAAAASSSATPCPMPGRRSSPSSPSTSPISSSASSSSRWSSSIPASASSWSMPCRSARHAGGAGLRPDLRRDLHPAQPLGRHRRDRHQSAAAASEMTDREDRELTRRQCPLSRRAKVVD